VQELHFYFLYEHKSSPERDTLLKLGRALFEVLFDLLEKRTEDEDHETDKTAQHSGVFSGATGPIRTPAKSSKAGYRWLPEIVPVILYHGTRRWNYPKQFSEHINSIDERADHLLRFKPFFISLQS
jgi:hypothetical protein